MPFFRKNMDEPRKRHVSQFFRHWCGVMSVSFLLLLVLYFWWNSSRYSERHLIYLGNCTLEVFTASSLLRLSFVNGHIANLGAKRFYRHPNPRGKMELKPALLSFRHQPNLWEVTMGYWHVAGLLVVALVGVGVFEFLKKGENDGK